LPICFIFKAMNKNKWDSIFLKDPIKTYSLPATLLQALAKQALNR